MDNYIIKTLAFNKQVRILFVDNTDMINEICNNKNINRLLKTALGKTVSIASLISGTLKGNQRVSIKVNASNQKHKIFADVDSLGNIRGFLNDELLNAALGYKDGLSIEKLIGEKGCIQVLKDLGINSIFTGITDMPHGNIVDDFSYYFRQSEQIPTLFSVDMVYNENDEIILSRGIMAQLLPGAPLGLMDTIKENISERQSVLFDMEKPFREIPFELIEDIEILGITPIQFFCGCSKEVFYPMLYSLSRGELAEACKSSKPIEIACNVCGKKYAFNSEDINNLIKYRGGAVNAE